MLQSMQLLQLLKIKMKFTRLDLETTAAIAVLVCRLLHLSRLLNVLCKPAYVNLLCNQTHQHQLQGVAQTTWRGVLSPCLLQ